MASVEDVLSRLEARAREREIWNRLPKYPGEGDCGCTIGGHLCWLHETPGMWRDRKARPGDKWFALMMAALILVALIVSARG